jgi:hypothetical protein
MFVEIQATLLKGGTRVVRLLSLFTNVSNQSRFLTSWVKFGGYKNYDLLIIKELNDEPHFLLQLS